MKFHGARVCSALLAALAFLVFQRPAQAQCRPGFYLSGEDAHYYYCTKGVQKGDFEKLAKELDKTYKKKKNDPHLVGDEWRFRKSVIDDMGRLIGIAYQWGGKIRIGADGQLRFECVDTKKCNPRNAPELPRFGLDCSGSAELAARLSACFVRNVYKNSLSGLMGSADEQRKQFRLYNSFIPPDGEPSPGDFVFFGNTTANAAPGQATHVGIYLGTTKEGEMAVIHASSHAGEVLATREKPGESFLGKRILGFGDVYRLMQLENTRH